MFLLLFFFEKFPVELWRADTEAVDEFPGHHDSVQHMHHSWQREDKEVDFYIPEDDSRPPPPVKIDKSNLLLIGPTGVGKTYILE